MYELDPGPLSGGKPNTEKADVMGRPFKRFRLSSSSLANAVVQNIHSNVDIKIFILSSPQSYVV
jgi:hypothetical protein